MKLFEMSGSSLTLFHYTTVGNLKKILIDGKLKTFYYAVGLHNVTTGKREKELATVRQSSSFSRFNLSKGAKGDVRFIIKTDMLRDKVRGVKVGPIAEFPIEGTIFLRDFLFNFLSLNVKEAKKMTKDLIKFYSYLKSKEEKREYATNEEMIKKEIKKFLEKESGKKINDTLFILKVTSKLEKIYRYLIKREGEERVSSKKDIPLNSDYLSIELLPGAAKKFFKKDEVYKKEMRSLFRKYNSLFVKNTELTLTKKRFKKTQE
jgi:hypothetical protein